MGHRVVAGIVIDDRVVLLTRSDLHALRNEEHISTELADGLGMSTRTVSNIHHDTGVFSPFEYRNILRHGTRIEVGRYLREHRPAEETHYTQEYYRRRDCKRFG
jgi:hypothetical protein